MFACADAGLIFVPLNIRWAVGELRHAVVDSGIKVMAILDRESVGLALELSSPAPLGGDPHLSWLLVGPLVGNVPVTSTTARSDVSQWRKVPVSRSDRGEDMAEREGGREGDDARGNLMYDPGAGEDRAQHGFVDEPVGRHSVQGAGCAALEADDTRDVFCIVHTSGSTGRSKGVALTHRGQVWSCPLWHVRVVSAIVLQSKRVEIVHFDTKPDVGSGFKRAVFF